MSVYVMSDVHGLKDRYDRMWKELLREEDTLYILGDVIDRGKDGIKILQDIRQRHNVRMLLGNHEYMMLEYNTALHDDHMDLYEKMVILDRWQRNHCQPTQAQFQALSSQEQEDLLMYLKALPLAICDLMVEGQCYYLVHGCAVPFFTKGTIYAKDLEGTPYTTENFVWDRIEMDTTFFQDRCVVLGHTPTLCFQSTTPYAIWTPSSDIQEAHLINIDCGCAADNAYTRMAVLRLEDRQVFYF